MLSPSSRKAAEYSSTLSACSSAYSKGEESPIIQEQSKKDTSVKDEYTHTHNIQFTTTLAYVYVSACLHEVGGGGVVGGGGECCLLELRI